MDSLDWSEPGDLILFRPIGERALWVVRPDGSGLHQLLEAPEDTYLHSPRWSPAGNAVYYFLATGQMASLWKVAVDPATGRRAGDPLEILAGIQGAGYCTFSRDGRRMVHLRVTFQANLWRVDLGEDSGDQGVDATQLTSGTLHHEYPRFSPDGRQIAVNIASGDKANIFVLPAGGGPARQVTFSDAVSGAPAWSPDGSQIAYASMEEGEPRLYRISVDGGTPEPVDRAGPVSELTWSPGAGILYRKAEPGSLYFLDPNKGEPERITFEGPTGWIQAFRYSPDGARIAAWFGSGGTPPRAGVGIFTAVSKPGRPSMHAGESASPVGWSPDGTWVYAVSGDGTVAYVENPRILRISADGSGRQTLRPLPLARLGHADSGDVSPDGKVYVGSAVRIESDAWLVEGFDLQGGRSDASDEE